MFVRDLHVYRQGKTFDYTCEQCMFITKAEVLNFQAIPLMEIVTYSNVNGTLTHVHVFIQKFAPYSRY